MRSPAYVQRSTPRQDGAYLVVVRLDRERRDVVITSREDLEIGRRVEVEGAGEMWRLAHTELDTVRHRPGG